MGGNSLLSARLSVWTGVRKKDFFKKGKKKGNVIKRHLVYWGSQMSLHYHIIIQYQFTFLMKNFSFQSKVLFIFPHVSSGCIFDIRGSAWPFSKLKYLEELVYILLKGPMA